MVIIHHNPKYDNNPQISSGEVFFCNASTAYRNKHKIRKGINSGYFPVALTAEALIQHLKVGHAITTGFFGKVDNYGFPKTDTAHWRSSKIFIIDCDHRSLYQLNQDEFVKQYAMCIYATPSSKPGNARSRAIFLLDTPITFQNQYKELAETLASYTLKHLEPDLNATKLTQRVYGSSNEYFIERPENILPLSVMKHQVTQYRAEKIIDAIMPARESKKVTVNSLSKEFRFHSNNTDSLLAGETLVEGERNNRINAASYNLTLRGWGEQEIMRKVLPLATFSGLGIRESERSILSGIKGAKRDTLKYTYSDKRHSKAELTDDAKQLLISVMQYDWKSGYSAMIAIAMCKMYARQGQGFFLTNSLMMVMSGFDAKTVAKHLKVILKTGLFKAVKGKQVTYRAQPTTDDTTLTIHGQTYTLTADIFDILLENRTNTETMTPAELLTFCQIANGKSQRQAIKYSRNYAQTAVNGLKRLSVLVRKGLHYVLIAFEGMKVACQETRPTVDSNDRVIGDRMSQIKEPKDAQKPHQLRLKNGVFGLDGGMAERLTPQME